MRRCLIAIIFMACGDDASGVPPDSAPPPDAPEPDVDAREPVTVTLTTTSFGTPTNVPFVAWQDGVASWVGLEGDAGVYTFSTLTGRFGLASVCGTQVTVEWRSTTDGTMLQRACDAAPTTVDVTGAVAGLGGGEVGRVAIDGVQASVAAPGGSYLLQPVAGTKDVVAVRSSAVESLSMIRRDDVAVAGPTEVNFDFALGGFDLERHAIALTGQGGTEIVAVLAALDTARGTVVPFVDAPDDASWIAVPSGRMRGDDVHRVAATALSPDGDYRRVERLLLAGIDLALTFPPPIAEPTVTVVTAPYTRLRTTVPTQAAFESYRLVAAQTGVTWSSTVLSSWLRGQTSVELEGPDFTAVPGWMTAWELQSGVETRWTVAAAADNRDAVPSGRDGLQSEESARTGTITP
jgi:hypothetical protein